MKILNRVTIARRRGAGTPATLELLHGDLARIPRRHAVDALVVSAFPNSYTPNRGTLFRALWYRGLDMRAVAMRKAEDQRPRLGCWISKRLGGARPLNIGRIVCFEPRHPEFLATSGIANQSIAETVGFVFRCLNNFAIPDARRRFNLTRVAMPLLATGNQQVPVEVMLPKLLEAAIFWLEEGLPIEHLKIVAHSRAQAALAQRVFAASVASRATRRLTPDSVPATAMSQRDWQKALAETVGTQVIDACTRHLSDRLLAIAGSTERRTVTRLFARLNHDVSGAGPAPRRPARAAASREYDVFISYAHTQERQVQHFVNALRRANPRLRIFHDRQAIPVGGQWIKLISDAVQQTRIFVAVLSPDYVASPVCWDEFQCAKLKEYNTRTSVIRTVSLYRVDDLPPILGVYSYIDCDPGNLAKLRAAANRILAPSRKKRATV